MEPTTLTELFQNEEIEKVKFYKSIKLENHIFGLKEEIATIEAKIPGLESEICRLKPQLLSAKCNLKTTKLHLREITINITNKRAQIAENEAELSETRASFQAILRSSIEKSNDYLKECHLKLLNSSRINENIKIQEKLCSLNAEIEALAAIIDFQNKKIKKFEAVSKVLEQMVD